MTGKKNWPVRKILLVWSLIFYLIPFIDAYLAGEKAATKSLHNVSWKKLPGKGARIYAVTLEDHTNFRIHQHTFHFMTGVDSINIYSTTLFNKVKKIYFDKEAYSYVAATGFFNTGGMSLLIIGTVFFLISSLLLFTKKLDHLQMADFGPYVMFALLLIYLFFYLTTD